MICRFFLYLTVVAGLLCSPGCSSNPETYPVSGTVSFPDGTLLSSGYVEMIPQAGGPSGRGSIGEQGEFAIGTYKSVDGVVDGKYDVLIVQHISPAGRRMARKLGDAHKGHEKTNRVVSLKYASRSTSDLECTVNPTDENHFAFVVEPK